MADEPRWSPVLDVLPTAVVLLDPSGVPCRQNAAADVLQERASVWPLPLPEDLVVAHAWIDGVRVRGERTWEGEHTWLTLQPLPPPDPGIALVMVLDERGGVLYQSAAFSLLGQDLVGGSFVEAIEAPEREDLLDALAEGGTDELAVYVRDRADQRRLLLCALVDQRHVPAVGGFLLVCRETTRLRRMQQRVRDLERRFLRMLEGIPTAVVIDVPGDGTQYINGRARLLFAEIGVSLSEVERWLRRGTGARVAGSEDSYPAEQMPTARAHQGEPYTVEDVEVLHNQERIVLELSAAPVKGRDGKILYIVTTLRAITARRRMEQQLQRVGRLDAVGQLAGELAHDFNNFLQVIGSCGMAAIERLPEGHPSRADLQKIVQTADRAEVLTRQLLTVSRRQPMTLRHLSLNTLLAEAAALLEHMVGDNIALSLSLDPEVWAVRVDKSMLERVLLNLVLNARDAMPDGGSIYLSTENLLLDEASAALLPEASAGAYAVVVVRDTGTGMSSEVLSHAFEPFYTTKMPGEGTGLGLSMAYGVVRQMDGYIQVRSSVGEGAEFRVALPRSGGAELPATETTDTLPGKLPHDLLVVDDEPLILSILVQTLRQHGYQVEPHASAESALAAIAARAELPDMIITDVELPGMSGVALAEAVWTQHPSMLVLFISGRVLAEALPGAFLAKPFTPEALTGAILRAAGRSPSDRDGDAAGV